MRGFALEKYRKTQLCVFRKKRDTAVQAITIMPGPWTLHAMTYLPALLIPSVQKRELCLPTNKSETTSAFLLYFS